VQFKVFSDPKRDARRHTVSVVFRCVAKTVTGVIKKGSDAKQVHRELLKWLSCHDKAVLLIHLFLPRSLCVSVYRSAWCR
jgi:ADP-ribose pyrophosphatase YjhB (NUDIX family)